MLTGTHLRYFLARSDKHPFWKPFICGLIFCANCFFTLPLIAEPLSEPEQETTQNNFAQIDLNNDNSNTSDTQPVLTGSIIQSPYFSEQKSISLKEALEEAIANNLDAQIQKDDNEIASLQAKILRGNYAPKVGIESYYQNENLPVTSIFSAGPGGKLRNEYWVADPFISGITPFGTKYELRLQNTRQTTNSFFQLLSPQYTSILKLSVTQPLLKNFWTNGVRRDIKVAKLNKNVSDAEFNLALQNLAYNTEVAYWDFVLANKTVFINQEAVQLAQEQLKRTTRLGEIGESPKIDAVSAQAELDRRLEELEIAREKFFRAENNLKLYIANGLQSPYWNKALLPSQTLVKADNLLPAPAEALKLALEKRPEFKRIDQQLKIKGVQRTYLINQGLPQVDLVAEALTQGIAGTPRATQFNFGGTTSVAPRFIGGYRDNFENLTSGDFNTIKLGLNMSWPVSPGTTKKVLKQADLERHQLELELAKYEQQVSADVYNSLNAIKTSEQRIAAAESGLKAALRQFEGEAQRFKIGLSTNFLVLTRQNDLSQAKLRLINAISDFNKAVSELQKSTGTILEEKNILVKN
jgi:outer membrane protein TolC